MEQIKTIVVKYWVEFVLGGVVSGMCVMWRRYIATQNGVQALLRAQIIQIYNKYIERGYVPIYERENIEDLFKQYKKLGGNGVISDLVQKLNALPTQEEH